VHHSLFFNMVKNTKESVLWSMISKYFKHGASFPSPKLCIVGNTDENVKGFTLKPILSLFANLEHNNLRQNLDICTGCKAFLTLLALLLL